MLALCPSCSYMNQSGLTPGSTVGCARCGAEMVLPGGLEEARQIKPNADFKPEAWRQYTPAELGSTVAFFLKRAGHRANPAKKAKDLSNAMGYFIMLGKHLEASGAKFLSDANSAG